MKRITRKQHVYKKDYTDLINFLKQFNDEKDSTTNNEAPKGSNTST